MEQVFFEGLFTGIAGVLYSISFIWAIFTYISNYILFQKAGEDGWKSLIPVYNLYIQQCITFGKAKGLFFLFSLIPAVGPIYLVYLTYNYGRSFGLSEGLAILYVFFTPFFNVYLAFQDSTRYHGPRQFFLD